MNNIFQNFNTAESAWKLSKALSSAALYKIFKNQKMLYGVNKTFVYICFTCAKFILMRKEKMPT